jgi:uncharacterized Zn finger protein
MMISHWNNRLIREEEIEKALKWLNNKKAPGVYFIYPTMLKYGGKEMIKMLCVL